MWSAIIIGVLLIAFLYKWMGKSGKYLVGMAHPVENFFLGSVLELKEMSTRPHLKLEEWANKLGDIYYFRVVSKRIVVLNNVDYIYEALVKKGKDFAGRIQSIRMSLVFGDMKGGVNDIGFHNPDKNWSAKRKVAQKSLKQFGEGMIRIQDLSLQFVSVLLEKFRNHSGHPFNPRDDVNHVVAGMMYTVTLGVEIADGTQNMKDALDIERLITASISTDAAGLLLDEMPFLRYFGNQCYKTACEARQKGDQFLNRLIKEEKILENRPDGVRGVVDDLYEARKELGEDLFSDECVYNIVRDLNTAGIGTTSPIFCSFINILAANMHVQKRMQEETHFLLGERKLPTLSDRDHMPYCRAAVYELLRYISVAPVLLPHVTVCDTNIAGYNIQKGTTVLMNVWAANHKQSYWGDPEVFRPERFLDEEGNLVPADHPSRKGMLTFGAGPRTCLGEILASNRMFLFVVSLLRNFDLLPDPDSKGAESFNARELEMVSVLLPKDYRIIARPRD